MRPDGCVAWRAVPGWVGVYEVSDAGNIRRIAAAAGTRIGNILVCRSNSSGYSTVTLSCGMRSESHKVHRIVARAFLGEPTEERPEVNHKNSMRTDNRVANLEWVSRRENVHHCLNNGRMPTRAGEANRQAKLTDREVREIVRLKGKVSQSVVAAAFGISRSVICDIFRGARWRHISRRPRGAAC